MLISQMLKIVTALYARSNSQGPDERQMSAVGILDSAPITGDVYNPWNFCSRGVKPIVGAILPGSFRNLEAMLSKPEAVISELVAKYLGRLVSGVRIDREAYVP